MKKYLFLICLLFGSLLACKHKDQIHRMTTKLKQINDRIENNWSCHDDGMIASYLIEEYNEIKGSLCNDCRHYSQKHLRKYINKSLQHFDFISE